MTIQIVQNEIQSHKVLRKLLSTRLSEEAVTAFDFTEFITANSPKKLPVSVNFPFNSYIANNTSCNRTLAWFIR